MRRYFLCLTLMVLVFTITACNQTQEPDDDTDYSYAVDDSTDVAVDETIDDTNDSIPDLTQSPVPDDRTPQEIFLGGGVMPQFFNDQAIDGNALIAAIDRIIIEDRNAPGYSMVVVRGGEPIFKHYTGTVTFHPGVLHTNQFYVNQNTREEYGADSTFQLASSTKLVAAALIFQLQEQGRLNIHDPIRNHIPEMYHSNITIFHALTHSTGMDFVGIAPLHLVGPIEWAEQAATSQRPLVFEPGSRTQYSPSYGLLLEIIRRVGGGDVDAHSINAMFEPLGMMETHFNNDRLDRSRLIMKNDYDKATSTDHLFFGLDLNDSDGNAGMFSTIDDMARFAAMMLGGGMLGDVRVMAQETVEAFAEPVEGFYRAVGAFLRGNHSSGMFPPSSNPGAFGHPGSTGEAIFIDPTADLAIVFIANNGSNMIAGDFAVLRDAMEQVYRYLR